MFTWHHALCYTSYLIAVIASSGKHNFFGSLCDAAVPWYFWNPRPKRVHTYEITCFIHLSLFRIPKPTPPLPSSSRLTTSGHASRMKCDQFAPNSYECTRAPYKYQARRYITTSSRCTERFRPDGVNWIRWCAKITFILIIHTLTHNTMYKYISEDLQMYKYVYVGVCVRVNKWM